MKNTKMISLLLLGGIVGLTSCKKDEEESENANGEGPVYSEVNNTFSSNATLMSSGNTQYFPILRGNTADPMVFWSEKDSNVPKVRGVKLSGNAASGSTIDVDIEVGVNNSGESTNQAVAYDPSSGKYLSVHMHNETGEFGMVGKLFTSADQSATQFSIDGPFVYTNDSPNHPEVAVSSNGVFGIVYTTNTGFFTSSKIAFKAVNANTGVVSPAVVADTQNGIELTDVQSASADIAWNSSANVFGIVYHSGTTTNAKIMFVSVNESGTIVTAPKEIHNIGNTVDYPKIKEDGDGFAVIWQDYSKVNFEGETELSGTPAIRLNRISATGDVKAISGDANLVNTTNKSVLMSNPYLAAAYIHFDFTVAAPNSKYGIVWATQDAPYQIQFAEATFTGDAVLTSEPVNVSVSTENSDTPSVNYINGKYVITYSGHTGVSYTNRIVVQN
jgi:hypothetical protein